MVFLVVLCLALALLLGGGYYAYRVAFYSPKAGREDLPVHKGKQYEPHLEEIARASMPLSGACARLQSIIMVWKW